MFNFLLLFNEFFYTSFYIYIQNIFQWNYTRNIGKKTLKNIFWDSDSESIRVQTQLFYLLTQPYRSSFLSFIAYFNHRHPSELLPFILYPIFNSQITKNSIYPLRTSNSLQIESNKVRTKSVQTCALCVAKENALSLLFLLLLFETSFEKMASFKSIRKRGCCFSRRSSLYRNRPRATLFIFLYVLLPLLEAIRRPRSSKHPFLAARTRNLREMVSLYCHQVFTSTRFAFYHARRGKIREIHDG